MLAKESQNTNVKLREVATRLVETISCPESRSADNSR
jgi:hypothetical protein